MATPSRVNNSIYDTLGDRWYRAKDDPIALLRAESRRRDPWLAQRIEEAFAGRAVDLLDVGCGAGFLANDLARARGDGVPHRVVAIDASDDALRVAASHDATGSVRYLRADARALPFDGASFDVVTAMDLLEHVEDKRAVVREAARVLRPGGIFAFHTFAKNRLSWLVVIKGVEWFVRNVPDHLHVLELFIDADDLTALCKEHGLAVSELHGLAPNPWRSAFLKMLVTGRVDDDFEFRFTRSTAIGYTGIARKR